MTRAAVVAVTAVAATLAATIASGQPRPAAPRAPASPSAPAAPPAPPSPDGAVSSVRARAFLFIGTRTASPDAAVVRLADALIGLAPERRAPRRREVAGLATLLHDGLRRRDLGVDARRRLATRLTEGLLVVLGGDDDTGRPGGPEVGPAVAATDDASADVRAAFDTIRAALREAGLGEPEIVLVEDEVRRLAPRPRPHHR